MEDIRPHLKEYIATTRAIHLWFHGAHNVTRGASFSGDHILLFDRIYATIQEDVDELIEKSIGITEDESMACPISITTRAAEILTSYPSPVSLSSLAIASSGKMLMKGYLDFLQHIHDSLSSSGQLTLGLDDYISSSANKYEDFLYMLQQREKSELQD